MWTIIRTEVLTLRVRVVWIIALLLVWVLALSGCATTPPTLQEQVKAVCGIPAQDLSNVDQYATCVNAVLDVENESKVSSR